MLVKAFLDYLRYERNYSERTITIYGTDVTQFRNFVAERNIFDLTEIKPEGEIVREWIVSLMESGYATTSVNGKLSSLRSFYRYLLKQGKVTINPLWRITAPKSKKLLPIFLKESEMNRLLDETDFGEGYMACRNRLIIEVFYVTGMRLFELISLHDSDIDFAASFIRVNGKRNKQRIIPFGDELKKEMLEYIDIRNEALLSNKPEAFFVRKNGEQLSRSIVGRIVRQSLSKVVTLKKKSPHVLRHTFATTMLNNEAELSVIKELLGHSSLTTTEIYTHMTFEKLKKIYKQAHPRA
ncbi:Tyrosine recombinase XerC [termite gut metagenome]|uniref:Tyrosine recombinase XerC n=1 Tax=termite gut metagenome TaxID=433724 RepID=A0A5J4SE01_9ZZZZ